MTRNPGLAGHRYRELRAQTRAWADHCWHCGQAIDRSLPDVNPNTGKSDPNAWTLAHKINQRDRPDLAMDPANMAGAHRRCNIEAGTDTELSLGTIPDW